MRLGIGLTAAAATLCLLAGCSLSTATPSVEELLRAPQLSGQHSQVQKALDSYLGESAQLKYPTSGQGLSPFVFGDLDGDGVQDAAVLYTSAAKGQNVHVAILEQADSGWTVTQEQEGLSTEVDSVSLASLQEGSSAQQLVVGYASPQGDQYLAVYDYQDSTLNCVLQEAYSRYLVADITGRGVEDLVVVAPVAEGGLRLKLLTAGPDGFTIGQELLTDTRFVDCAALQISRGSDGGHYLVMDGLVGSSGSYMASCLFRCDEAGRQLEPVLREMIAGLVPRLAAFCPHRPGELRLRLMTSRWGSCNPRTGELHETAFPPAPGGAHLCPHGNTGVPGSGHTCRSRGAHLCRPDRPQAKGHAPTQARTGRHTTHRRADAAHTSGETPPAERPQGNEREIIL